MNKLIYIKGLRLASSHHKSNGYFMEKMRFFDALYIKINRVIYPCISWHHLGWWHLICR